MSVGVAAGGAGAVTVSVTFTSTGAPPPDAGVIVTVVVYVPASRLLASAVNVTVEDFPPASLSLAGPTVSQPASDGICAVHFRMPPAVLVTVIDCGVTLLPAVALKDTLFVLTCIEGGATLMVIDITTGLPATALPLIGSAALMVRLVVYVPLATPVASTDTFTFTPDPPARPVPEAAESDTKLGASEARVPVQFIGSSPVFDIVTGCSVPPLVTLIVNEPGFTARAGGACTLSFTSPVCGLPTMVIPLFTAESEIEPA